MGGAKKCLYAGKTLFSEDKTNKNWPLISKIQTLNSSNNHSTHGVVSKYAVYISKLDKYVFVCVFSLISILLSVIMVYWLT